jgi:hypothetical protein
MAVTVSGKNYTQLSSCDSSTAGGTWSSTTADSANKKEGSASLSFIMKTNGTSTVTFTPTSSVNLDTKHIRWWFLCSSAGLLDIESNDGIEIGMTDGTNTGYWTMGGGDTYEGGWINYVLDTTRAVDNGTKPTSMSAITAIYFRITQTALGKNTENVWLDNVCVADGLLCYGDDSGGYFDFDDIWSADDTSLGIGIVRKINGQYFATGSIEFGDSASTNGCKFQAKSQVFIFEDRPVSTTLYNFTVVDNGTGTTEFILGDKSGTAGIQGCVIRVASSSQTPKFDIDGSTDTDVDNFKLYGSTFYGADAITFPSTAANVEIINCSFELCGQVDPSSASVSGCFFIDTSDADAALLWNESIDIEGCSFIANTTGAGVEHPSATGTPYTHTSLLYSGNTYDVLNSSGSAITVTKAGTPVSNPSTSEGSSVTYQASLTITITVQDEATDAIIGVQTAVYKISDRTEIMNEDTIAGGVATEVYTGSTPVDVEIRCRKASGGATKYVNYSTLATLNGNFDLLVTMKEDTKNNATT